VTAGASVFVQVLVNPAAPAGGENLTITTSNPAASVPPSLAMPAGTANGQFAVTGNNVTAPTAVTVTVSLGTASASFSLTVTPAATPAVASIATAPSVVASGDPVTVNVTLAATAPPGGVTVSLASDSAAAPLPTSVAVPAGSGQAQIPITAGAVTSTTVAHLTATMSGKTVTGQLEIDPARTLTNITIGPSTTDGSKGATGSVTVSIPAADGNTTVSLQSSNPAVASVPASVGFLYGQSSTTFPISTTAVTAATDVVISAAAGGVTMTATVTVGPTPPPPFDVQAISVAPSAVHGPGAATGTLTMTTAAPAGGATVNLSTSDVKSATVPATIFVPAGSTSVNFPIRVIAQNGSTDVAIGETFQNLGRAAPLGVTPASGGTLINATQSNQVLEVRHVNDGRYTLGFYSGGTAAIESGQMPPGVSLISNLRPGEFVFNGSPQKAGTYTFVLKFTGQVVQPYTIPYVWTILP
jgi:hypothetical protein